MHSSLHCSMKQHHTAPYRDRLQGLVGQGLFRVDVGYGANYWHKRHGKEVNGWNVKKCFLEVAGHTIGGSTAPVFPSCSHPQPVSAVSASIAPSPSRSG